MKGNVCVKKIICYALILNIFCFGGCNYTKDDVADSSESVCEDNVDVSEETTVEDDNEVPEIYDDTEQSSVSTPAYLVDVTDEVYRNLITDLVETNIFPVSNFPAEGIPSSQFYTVMDIDEDEKEELLIKYSGANSMAGTVLYIYDYDRTTGEVYIEHFGWPQVIFYNNGYVKEEASHNHGRSDLDAFWPYQLIVYNAEKDKYESFIHVDAWQKEIIPKEFPEEADKDGDGIVYYTAPASYIPEIFMDRAEYDAWCEPYTGTPKEIQWKAIMTYEEYAAIYMEKAN